MQNGLSKIKALRNKLAMQAFVGFENVERINVGDIPDEGTLLSDKGDYWIRKKLDYDGEDEDVDACLYKAPKAGFVFPNHVHDNDESWVALCSVVVSTPFMERTLHKGDVIKIPKNVVHRATFLEAGKIIIVWNPKFEKGWESKVLKKEIEDELDEIIESQS